ncbi:MAG: hypothetical protein ACRELX_03570 [Longimicrobiales bacterium]
MRRAPLLLALAVAGATGCAALQLGGESEPDVRLELGLDALAERDFDRAQQHLEWVYRNYWQQPVGQEALLVLVASELDPRNTTRRLWASADMAARLLGIPQAPRWMDPVGESMYLLALELGANEDRLERARAALDSAQALPKYTGPSIPVQMQAIRSERDSLKVQLETLQAQREQLDKELKEKTAELERIRKTVKG